MLEKKLYINQLDIRKEVSKLLESAFPIDERPPTKYFFKTLEKKENKLFAYYHDNTFIGFSFLSFYKDVCYIFFLAVQESYRHQGFGGQILEDVKKEYSDLVLLLCYEEVDPKYPNYEERVNRAKFYHSHGFQPNKLKTNEYGVIYETAYIGSHQVVFSSYQEIFVLGFGERSRPYIKEA